MRVCVCVFVCVGVSECVCVCVSVRTSRVFNLSPILSCTGKKETTVLAAGVGVVCTHLSVHVCVCVRVCVQDIVLTGPVEQEEEPVVLRVGDLQLVSDQAA